MEAEGDGAMTDDEIARQKEWALDRAKSILEEHFGTGVILVAAPIPGDRTMKFAVNFGDVYACIGLAMVFARRAAMGLDDFSEGME